MSARGITIVSASAGSGKTYRLTQDVTAAIDPNASERVSLEGLVAVTFTRKAHAELAARIRHKLVSTGAYEEAMRMPLAYLGTVHAACLRLLQEFALDAGLSPHIDVVAGSQAKLLRQALESALDLDTRRRIHDLASRVELRLAPQTKRLDWITPVADIMELARSNRIAPDQLPAMAERSSAGLLALLSPPAPAAAPLDDALVSEMERTLRILKQKQGAKGPTKKAIDLIEASQKKWRDKELRWSDWVKLSLVKPEAALEDTVAELNEAARAYTYHPRLHSDLRELTSALYDAARLGLTAYQAWKTERRVVDYVDMLDRALDLVEHPRVKAELAERLGLVVVDEFQDTSPIQLALFVRLHQLANRSVWVGDRKQCIFEYAGADPALMDDVTSWVVGSGGARDRLERNYRSRRELVDLSNALFSGALARHGFTAEEVSVQPTRDAVDGLPPVGVWWLETTTNALDAQAIAEGVRQTLSEPEKTKIVDRTTGELRPVRPGDIAVLVTTNACAREVAGALHQRGIRSAIARAGLLSTPEGTLVDSALRWVLDGNDSLAAANLDALTGFENRTADVWLEQRIHEARERTAPSSSWRGPLARVRESASALSPSEAVDCVLEALDATQHCARWPDAAQRIANLDAIRALTSTYEHRCAQDREAATIAGLLRCFDDLREERLMRDEMLASDDQHVPSDDGAVVVATYHKSKGLEWPVVVLANLDKQERRDAFDVAPETEAKGFDPERPLEGRWIRYWPWPFGQTKKTLLADAALQSAEGLAVAVREDKERARLLYVGFTRARDHLVLAVRFERGRAKKEWLDCLRSEDGAPLVDLPLPGGPESVMRVAGAHAVEARVLRLSGVAPASEPAASARESVWFAREASAVRVERASYWVTPSAAEAASDAVIGAVERLPSPLLVDGTGYDYAVLGNAVHAFLAADVARLDAAERTSRAKRILKGSGLASHIRVEALLAAGDHLRAWAEAKWPDAKWHREVNVDALVVEAGVERRVRGIVDLLLETAAGFVLIDHKTFPALNEAAWRVRCASFAPQLAAYALVLSRASAKPVLERWVHLPVGGALLQVCVDDERVVRIP